MATSKVIYLGNLRTQATHLASGQSIITDAPVDNHGRGEAFSPTDLTATSLAACIITTMAIGAEPRGINIEKAEAEVQKIMASGPRRISGVHVEVKMKISPDTPENRSILEQIGNACPVQKSLHTDIDQQITFSYE
jgi:uncharacterized OsmC-like protein